MLSRTVATCRLRLKIMQIEITCQGITDTLICPPETDFVGVSIANVCNVNTDFSAMLSKTLFNCVKENKVLFDGTLLTAYFYEFFGSAKVLSLKDYSGLVYSDISYGDIKVRVIA